MADADGGVVVCAIDGAAGRGNTSLAARTAQSLTSSFPNVRSVTGQHGRGAGRDLFAARDALRTLLRALEGQ